MSTRRKTFVDDSRVKDGNSTDTSGYMTLLSDYQPCKIHPNELKVLYCVDCSTDICSSCADTIHRNDTVLSKVENSNQESFDDLNSTRTRLEKTVSVVAFHQQEISYALQKLEGEITKAGKVDVLGEDMTVLQKQVRSLQQDFSDKFKAIASRHEKELATIVEHMSTVTLNRHTSSVRKGSTSVAESKPTSVYENVKEGVGRIKGRKASSSAVSSGIAVVAKKFDLPSQMFGMTVLSQDTVIVGYGAKRHGIDSFSISGCRMQRLIESVGVVADIAYLSDGRSVISHNSDTIRIYNRGGTPTKLQFKCVHQSDFICAVSCDEQDFVYSVNGSSEINIFQTGSERPHRVIPTGTKRPTQICVTKTGTLITSTGDLKPSMVTVYSKDGIEGSTIEANESDDEFLYAAVDDLDRVFVARVKLRSDILRLSAYTLDGTRLVEQTIFDDLQLSDVIKPDRSWCYMTCPKPDTVTISIYKKLYFFKLSPPRRGL